MSDILSQIQNTEFEGVNPEKLLERLTPRQLGLWEITTGMQLQDMPSAYQAALMAWWSANESGTPMTPDEALDLPAGQMADWAVKGVELLGKDSTPPSEPHNESGSED